MKTAEDIRRTIVSDEDWKALRWRINALMGSWAAPLLDYLTALEAEHDRMAREHDAAKAFLEPLRRTWDNESDDELVKDEQS